MGKNLIVYFSGSGHSLAVAMTLSKKLQARLLPVTAIDQITSKTGILGFVFPVYHATFGESGIPFIVKNMIKTLPVLSDTYIFAVCTHAGKPNNTIPNLNDLLQKCSCRLSAGFELKLNVPYSAMQKILAHFFNKPLCFDLEEEFRKRQKIKADCDRKIDDIVKTVLEGEIVPVSRRSLNKRALAIQRKMAIGRYRMLSGENFDDLEMLTKRSDRSFVVDQNCLGCGTCADVCAADNIELKNKRPVWLHHCENCFACFHWCPVKAIHGEIVKYEKPCHHMDITVGDMLTSNSVKGTYEA
jgi:ferredoxin